MKVSCWHIDSNHDSLIQALGFAATPSKHDLAIFMASHGKAPLKWPVLWREHFSEISSKQSGTLPRLS